MFTRSKVAFMSGVGTRFALSSLPFENMNEDIEILKKQDFAKAATLLVLSFILAIYFGGWIGFFMWFAGWMIISSLRKREERE